MSIIAAMRLVARCAALLECRLVQVRLLELLGLIGVASQTCTYGIGLYESGRLAGMRVVACGAIALGPWMLHLGFLDFFCLLSMAGHADGFCFALRQDDFAILCRLMACVA